MTVSSSYSVAVASVVSSIARAAKLTVYTLEELLAAYKAQVRGSIDGVSTSDDTDHGLMALVTVNMLQGAQVAAKYVYDQMLPSTADATNRDALIDRLGLSFERSATKASGLIMLFGTSGKIIPAGTQLDFPADAFHDGVARSYVTLDDAYMLPSSWAGITARSGTTEYRVRVNPLSGGMSAFAVGDALTYLGIPNAVRRVNDDQTLDLYLPIDQSVTAGDAITKHVGWVVRAEAVESGATGNAEYAAASFTGLDYSSAYILQMGGGGNAIVGVDADEARVIRVIEDTLAFPPALGNDQHIRELALACPDVDLDDAIVYRHARGPGTIDVVCIGRSGRAQLTNFPGARTDFTHGWNRRKIGDFAASKVEAWLKSKLGYHDDVKCRSVEYEYQGENATYDIWNTTDFFRSVTDLDIAIDYHPGYGPDCGVDGLSYVPSVSNSQKLYPPSGTVDASLKVGDRVWVRLGTPNSRHPHLTLVTKILSIPPSRSWVTVADLQTAWFDHSVIEWGCAGPLTQPIIDACYDYFDQLGPGSYVEAPLDPGYVRSFLPSSVVAPTTGRKLHRWPDEGRRWSAGFRKSELLERIMSIEGVKSVSFDLADFSPLPFQTLALCGVYARY